MLEHVAPNQTRFVAPGLAPDSRGVALGRYLVVLLPSVDRVVGLFRGLSESLSLDELLPSLRILQVETPLSSREFLVLVPVTNSYAADQAASVAGLIGGLAFTGSAKHFVKYRDGRSPLGHDVDGLFDGQGDFILYGADFVQSYRRERELAFDQLVLNLSLQAERDHPLQDDEPALLRVVRGLYPAVLSYLHRRGVVCGAAACELLAGAEGDPQRAFLIRCARLPRGTAALLDETPGIELHRLALEGVAVQVGYRHPLELGSCSSIFSDDRFYLMSGQRDLTEVVQGPLHFVDAASLVRLDRGGQLAAERLQVPAEPDAVEVPLRLVATAGAVPRIVASRVPLTHAPWLRKLIYLLPPQIIGSYGICVTHRHIYLLNEDAVEFIPLGEMFHAVAPGVMAPVGLQLVPRVHPDVLLQHLRAAPEQRRVFFFVGDEPGPVELSRDDFLPLGRAALAQVTVRRPQTAPLDGQAPPAPALTNDPVGIFPLWGFDADVPDDEPL